METISPKPFLKWAGGKGQLLGEFRQCYPPIVFDGTAIDYYEPFVGGGAVFFDIACLSNLEHAVIGDSNQDLIALYKLIQHDVEYLIEGLTDLSERFYACTETGRLDFYCSIRDAFNGRSDGDAVRPIYLLFLNRTCYNGLFRVNKKGLFNVPIGRYKKPKIVNPDNLRAAARLLARVEIRQGDFEDIVADSRGGNCFVYFDPPYRPLNKTSRFNSYEKSGFSDKDQSRLAKTARDLSRAGCRIMLSNSNPLNSDPSDFYLHRLYQGFNIREIYANRMINSSPARRGKVSELLVTNY